ncbi:MAG: hypothetical protein ABIJ20_00030 [Nanoarchaeota archaeon]|nr:hypothetical protein [Nanoarchaeota archaeon]MBU1445365.1 hypothetical protein [Nanoarchaeota archaeon]MBU2420138.1 hypothetical protein [Nanoarchaeota archaeon]MBU2475244.1 hypothetical protein [Nanoarchaeota archaeon]
MVKIELEIPKELHKNVKEFKKIWHTNCSSEDYYIWLIEKALERYIIDGFQEEESIEKITEKVTMANPHKN